MRKIIAEKLLSALSILQDLGPFSGASSTELAQRTGLSLATVKRQLAQLVNTGVVASTGQARATRYRLVAPAVLEAQQVPETYQNGTDGLIWSPGSRTMRHVLSQPLASRNPVTYQRSFVDDYLPNHSALLPRDVAAELASAGRMAGQQPAGTYARKVLEQLLIDLSWSSSRLEGNRYTLPDTVELFQTGLVKGDSDAVMLLNHKRAIEFLVEAAPEYGLTAALVRNLHAVLMQDLLADTAGLGAIRQKVVNISHTVYVPTQNPALLEEMFELILHKSRLIKNPVEAAFFLWLQLAYLQPFEDGNKRSSRLAANVPLMLYNCAPLSFLDVDLHDYALAMIAVYERRDVAMAIDLFVWTYRRSLRKYQVIMEAMGAPDPLRLKYRELLSEVMVQIVRERCNIDEAYAALQLSDQSVPGLREMLVHELSRLDGFNCARFRLTMGVTEAWIRDGRPQ